MFYGLLFLTVLLITNDLFFIWFLQNDESNYRLCEIQSKLTNFRVFFDCVTPLCEMPYLISDQCRKHVSIIQGFVAQNFSGHDMEI